jgi:hypothetical protein
MLADPAGAKEPSMAQAIPAFLRIDLSWIRIEIALLVAALVLGA